MPGSNCGQCGYRRLRAGGGGAGRRAKRAGHPLPARRQGAGRRRWPPSWASSVDLSAVADDGPQIAQRRRRNLHRLLPLHQGLPDRRHRRRRQADPQRDPRSLHRLRRLRRPLPDRGDDAWSRCRSPCSTGSGRSRHGRWPPEEHDHGTSSKDSSKRTALGRASGRPQAPGRRRAAARAAAAGAPLHAAAAARRRRRRGPSCWSARRCSRAS